MDEDQRDESLNNQSQIERLLAKACCYFLMTIEPKGLAVFDETTGEKFCFFYDKETMELKCQQSDTVEYDLELCIIKFQSELN